jgi:hypothetical protein
VTIGQIMAEIHFTSHLRNLVRDGPLSAAGATVGEALMNVLAAQPHMRGYVLDDRGALRKHVCIFADGEHPTVNSTSCRRCRAARPQNAWGSDE